MATNSPSSPGLSPAGADLGLGDMLGQQVQGETAEQRKKRMAQMQQQQQLGPAGSLAVTSLFGMNGAGKSAG
jgi:signal recognition particle GTPase